MLSEKDLKEWFSGLTREKILIDNHARRRSRLRVFSEENIYSLLIEHPFKKIIKNKEDTNVPKFEVH
ncbi:hypothetical protein HYG87_10660 [Methanobacterium alkalithermotolerans]|uniref:Uncharacterized protein n=1 Tax=Methanobacterium alkalithermotolerans TaxID=2731220 RepID=A0A8T8K9C2_9EURY|nr:hypothetical protein [Methanobacterium alkalithermotolerans]QUH24185.1 hypothetical protein HYG87_10660 [Methanobacterium alkalithermotolerans]